jgi:imidazolonepropionase-like amidohydrolase
MAHVYTSEGITRAAQCGIRTIEHGNFLDEDAAEVMAQRGAFLVPTLSVYHADKRQAREIGLSEATMIKNDEVIAVGGRSLGIAARAGVDIALGSDLSYSPLRHKPEEIMVRSEFQSSAEIIRSATVVGARVLRREGKLGVIKPGAHADLLVVDGNPLDNIHLLCGDGGSIPGVILSGRWAKDELQVPPH